MKRIGSFIDRAEFLFMRTCSMKKVSILYVQKISIAYSWHPTVEFLEKYLRPSSQKNSDFLTFYRDHAITTVNSKNSEGLPAKHSRQHVSLFIIPNQVF